MALIVLGPDLDGNASRDVVEGAAPLGFLAFLNDLLDRVIARNDAVTVALAGLDGVVAPAKFLQRRARARDHRRVLVGRMRRRFRRFFLAGLLGGLLAGCGCVRRRRRGHDHRNGAPGDVGIIKGIDVEAEHVGEPAALSRILVLSLDREAKTAFLLRLLQIHRQQNVVRTGDYPQCQSIPRCPCPHGEFLSKKSRPLPLGYVAFHTHHIVHVFLSRRGTRRCAGRTSSLLHKERMFQKYVRCKCPKETNH